jgi:glycosyltransferase involved in cell wall biosynthesis
VIDYFFHKINNPVKISMVMMVKNEEDVIEQNIRFHAAIGVDNFVVLDNGSTDNTTDILKELSKTYEISLEYNPSTAYKQKEWMTKLAKKAKKIYNPDWIINNDADEFWIPTDITKSLKDVLNFKGGVLQVPRSNMILYEGLNSWMESEYRVANQILNREDYENSNIMLGKIGRKTIVNPHGYIKTNAGNHSAEHIAFWKKQEPKNIHIYHYPFRSWKQFENKAKLYAEILKSNPKAKIGVHVKKWAKMYMEGKLLKEFEKMVFDNEKLKCLQDINIIKKDTKPKELFKKFNLLR